MPQSQQLVATIGIAVCWVAFASVWVVGAIYNAAKGPRRARWNMMPRSFVGIIVASVAVLVVVAHVVSAADWDHLQVDSLWVTGFGLAILLLSTAFTLWARAALGTMWSIETVLRENHQLRTDGPYGITRNPIYTGVLGMLLGSVLLAGVGSWILILPFAVVVFGAKIRSEERLMAATFPDDYARYRQHVPQVVPWFTWRLEPKH
ncbi:MAG: isoprenylcysteine carboxylmethyltransferase family protein [Candidatus Dormiibacterota bacterium]